MRHYLDMTEAIDKLFGVHSDYVDYAREQSKNLTIDIDDLLTKGWHGEAANTFSDFYTRMDTAHRDMADGVEKWHEIVRGCSQNTGREAILNGCNAVLQEFEGSPIRFITGILEYEDAVVDNMTTASQNFFMDMNDICDRLDSVNRKANSLNRCYSSLKIKELSNKISEYGEGNLHFSNGYVQATNTYSQYINKLYSFLLDAVAKLDTTYKGLEKVKPTISTNNPTSPAYRALAFSEVLVSLPAADRAAIEKLAYDAQEPYRTVFFAYIDKVNILTTDGIPGAGGSMSLPNIGIFLDTSDNGLIEINGQMMPRWYAVLFHEIGHTIDYATDNSDINILDDSIKQDVTNMLERLGQGFSNDPDAIKKAIDNIMNGKRLDKQPTDPSKQLQWDIQEQMKRYLKGDGDFDGDGVEDLPNGTDKYRRSGVSDVYGGVTKNAVKGTYGHDDSYWGIWQGATAVTGLIGLIPHLTPGLELFAENFSDGMLNYTDKRAQQDVFLGETSKLLNGDTANPNDAGMMGDVMREAQYRMGR